MNELSNIEVKMKQAHFSWMYIFALVTAFLFTNLRRFVESVPDEKIGLPTSRTVLEMTGLKNSETNFSIFKTKENSGLPLF